MYNDFDGNYKTVLDKSGKCTVEVKRLGTLELEVSRLWIKNPAFIEEIFHRTKWLIHRSSNIQINIHKTAKYGDKNLRTLGPHIWNSIPEHKKVETNFVKFKEYINQWFGPIYKCNLCGYINK